MKKNKLGFGCKLFAATLLTSVLFASCGSTKVEYAGVAVEKEPVLTADDLNASFTCSMENWSKAENWVTFSKTNVEKEIFRTVYHKGRITGGFTAKVKISSDNLKTSYGVTYGNAKKEAFYTVLITPDGYFLVYAMSERKGRPLNNWTFAKSIKRGAGAENLITFRPEGKSLAVYINDEFVYIIRNPLVTSGNIGYTVTNIFYPTTESRGDIEASSTIPISASYTLTEVNIPTAEGYFVGGSNINFASDYHWTAYRDGSVRYESRMEQKEEIDWLFFPYFSVTDFNLKITNEENGDSKFVQQVFFATKFENNKASFYQVNIKSNGLDKGMYQIVQAENGMKRELTGWRESDVIAVGKGAENNVSVTTVKGNHIISINGQEIYIIVKPSLKPGLLGYFVSTGKGEFAPAIGRIQLTDLKYGE